MKILVMSDTHIPKLESSEIAAVADASDFPMFPEIMREKMKEADIIVHAGDFESKEIFDLFEKTGKLKAVYGNNDGKEIQAKIPERLVFEENGVKFGVIHQAGISLNENTARWYLAQEMGVDVLLFGHIHTPMIDEYHGKYLICPGSPIKARMSDPSVVEIELDETKPGVVGDIRVIPVGAAACGYLKFRNQLEEEKEKGEK
ncbi:hypothetical protein MsAg5_04370 [Methanosarcinaceae archaeon Ag5]|uniref:Phosphoesterase n=1 Tax=Methanolapillus africanus TaxID=3028297 RepID=A0AAE4SCM8_9EURY|nr:hypothetical protein [Methanosarcinaceae archaeon Ag5]